MDSLGDNGKYLLRVCWLLSLFGQEESDPVEPEEGEEEPQPRALHKTCSIFLRNLAPTITKQEVEAVSSQIEAAL